MKIHSFYKEYIITKNHRKSQDNYVVKKSEGFKDVHCSFIGEAGVDIKFQINAFLKNIYSQNVMSLEDFAKLPSKNPHIRKTESVSIDLDKFKHFSEKCYLLDDYQKNIRLFEEIKTILQSKETINSEDLLILLNYIGITIFDENKDPKFTIDGYKYIRQNDRVLGITDHDKYIDIEKLSKILRKKKFLVKLNVIIPKDQIVGLAVYLHKSIIINYQGIIVAISMHTSNKEKTVTLSSRQEADDVENEKKQQQFAVFDQCMEVNLDQNERLILDLLIRGFDTSINIDGQNVSDIIYDAIMAKSDDWSKNPIQKPYVFDINKLYLLANVVYENKILTLEKEYAALKTKIDNLPNEAKEVFIKILHEKKRKFHENKLYNRYYASLPEEEQLLLQALKEFSTIEQQDSKKKDKASKKQQIITSTINKQKTLKNDPNNTKLKITNGQNSE